MKDVFGVNLQEQGRGFYVALELLAIIRGVLSHSPDELLSPNAAPVTYDRHSHDLARRIAVGDSVSEAELAVAVQGADTMQTLEALLGSLLVEIPGRRKAPRWFAAHLYPFVGELVHYDAAMRRGNPQIERYVFRDGGGWAYYTLRTDADAERRTATRGALTELIADSQTSLGRVASSLQSHDFARPTPLPDTSEGETETFGSTSPWPELLRSGIHSIVTRTGAPRAKRIEGIMHWAPYCLARHELHLARHRLGLEREAILLDMTRDANPLRRRSQEQLDEFRSQIATCLTNRASEKLAVAIDGGDVEEAARWEKYVRPNANFTRSPRAFFSETLAAVGALNSTVGRRHFTFKAPLLEALVAALVPHGRDEEFYTFCARLHVELGLVLDDRTANSAQLTESIDAGVFEVNADAFKARLRATGLLTHYSDATSIVHGDQR
ncbi:hypothetical protein [Kribbella endophytica]